MINNTSSNYAVDFAQYIKATTVSPLLLLGDAASVLAEFPSESCDCCMTSPPYWAKREYHNGGIGLEDDYRVYICHLLKIFSEVKRVLKPTGSFWLNIGDTYCHKRLTGIPWRIALALVDEQGWTLRDSVIWNKVKGSPDNATDRLRNVHENIFHFIKNVRDYYFDADAIRSTPSKAKVENGAVVSASGVRGVRYRRQIELSTELSDLEKKAAFLALDGMLQRMMDRELSDFRMIIRGQQRTTHSDAERVSGRARELIEKGFYFLRYSPNGSIPSDVWDILPEDTQNRAEHFAPYPEDLCLIPILSTCPPEGLVLDPFCGTGTTLLVANRLGRKSVGIEISDMYLSLVKERCGGLL